MEYIITSDVEVEAPETTEIVSEVVSRIYISGVFSAKINIAHATNTALLPRELMQKAVVLNNSSLQGTVKYACEGGDIERFTDMIKYVDLSSSPYFSELFIENMNF